MVGRKRSSSELRALWKKSIMEQILLIRMDKENKTLDGKATEFTLSLNLKFINVNHFSTDIQKSVELKRLKLTYEGPSCTESASSKWEELLEIKESYVEHFLLQQAIREGNKIVVFTVII